MLLGLQATESFKNKEQQHHRLTLPLTWERLKACVAPSTGLTIRDDACEQSPACSLCTLNSTLHSVKMNFCWCWGHVYSLIISYIHTTFTQSAVMRMMTVTTFSDVIQYLSSLQRSIWARSFREKNVQKNFGFHIKLSSIPLDEFSPIF